MMLFLLAGWSGLTAQVRVIINSPDEIASRIRSHKPTDWGGAVTAPITADAALVQDNNPDPAKRILGCQASAAGAYAGRIAIVRRGECEFGAKAKNAEDAGAIAVLIVNNVAGVEPAVMGAGVMGSLVTVPTLAVTMEDGEAIIAALMGGETVNITIRTASFSNVSTHFGIQNFAIPSYLNTNSIDSLGMTLENTSGQTMTNVILKYAFERENGEVLYSDSSAVVSMAAGEQIPQSWDLSASPIDLSDLEPGNYRLKYAGYSQDDTGDLPTDNVKQYPYSVTSGLWALENGANSGYRSNQAGPYFAGNIFSVPELNNIRLTVDNMSFSCFNSTDLASMNGVSVGIYLAELLDVTFDNTLNIFEESQFRLVGFGSHVLQDSDRSAIIPVELEDPEENPGTKPTMEGGKEYWLVNYYSGENAVLLYHMYDLNTDYKDLISLFYVSTWGGLPNPAVSRLNVDISVSTNAPVLPESAVSVFPNPANEAATIRFDFAQAQDAALILTDLSGRLLKMESLKGMQQGTHILPTAHLSSGTYILHIDTKQGYRALKLIVQH